MTYPVVKLEEIAEVRLGRQRSPKNHVGTHMRPYLRAANVGWDGLKLDDVKQMNFTDAEMALYSLRPGDLLLTEASGSPGEVGKPVLWNGELGQCAFQNTLIRVRPRNAGSRYLLHFFRHEAQTGAFAAGSRGVGINHLGQAALAGWPVPLPSLDEQRQIVAILDQADLLQQLRLRAVAAVGQLMLSLYLSMFGDPDEAIRSGRTVALSDVVAELQGGKSLVANDPTLQSRNRVLKISAVTSGTFLPNESKPLPDDYAPGKDHFVRDGDLLISRANTRELVGAVSLAESPPPNLVLPDKLWRFVWREPSAVEPLFVLAMLSTPAMRRQLSERASGTGGSMKNISKAKLQSMPLVWPGIAEQRAFADRVRAVRALRAKHVSAANFPLRASLAARAFSGQL